MRFVRGLWRVLIGIKDALVLVLMILFFSLLYMALSARPAPVVADGVLAMDLTGSLVEQPSEPDPFALLSGQSERLHEHRLRDLVAALDAAREDERVKAVALDLDGFLGGGRTAVGDLATAVGRVKASGKPVVAYATAFTDAGYQLAAHASEVWMNPLGTVAITGPGRQNLYYKGLLDKLGVTANVYRAGTYKAAVEPFVRSDMSPEARQDAQALANALYESWREDVARARPAAALDSYVRDTPAAVAAAGGDLAAAAVRSRLVDRLGTRHEFERRLVELGGSDADAPGGYRRIRLDSYIADIAGDDRSGPVGVVTVAGNIIDGRAGPGTAGGETIARLIENGLDGDRLKALVVRIDSPGGSVTASERIRQAILAAKAKKIPVVVSMGNVAASGGYWIATSGDHIFAEPSTITGSIGVFGILPSFQGTLDKLGIGADGVKTTPLSGQPDVLNGPSPEAGQLIQAGVDSIYSRFVALVAQSRKMPAAKVETLAEGRVWDGGAARQLGLVDQFGSLDDAIVKARQLARLDADAGVRYLDKEPSVRDQLLSLFSDEESGSGPATDALAALGPAPAQLVATALADVQAILSGPTIQIRCLECPMAVAPRPLRRDEHSLAELVLPWLSR